MKKLFRLTLDTNPEDCNLKCIMCEGHSRFSNFKDVLFATTGVKARRMPSDWIDKIFQEAKELAVEEIIPSTMGEPLLFEEIDKFFILAKKYDIKINLTTNGTFPKKSIKEWAELIIPVTSDTKISFNGATKEVAESIMEGINFEKQLSNIKSFIEFRDHYFRKSGFYSRITLQLTFLKSNMHQLPDIIKLAAGIGIDRIKGHHLWTHFDEIKELSFKKDKRSISQWNTIVDRSRDSVEYFRKPNGEKIILEHMDYLELSESDAVPANYECPFLGKELWVSATGKISPCCAPDKNRDSLGDFGNYSSTSLKEVLVSQVYNELVSNYKKMSLCQTCVMRKP